MQIKRIFLLAALGFVGIFIMQQWTLFSQEKYQEQQAQIAASANDNGVPESVNPNASPDEIPAAPANASSAETPTAESAESQSGQIINVKTDVVDVDINTYGGDLVYLGLLEYPTSLDTPDDPYELLSNNQALNDIFVVQNGLFGGGERDFPNHTVEYQASGDDYKLEVGADKLEVPLIWQGSDGVIYEKVYIFTRGSYRIEVEYRVNNQSASVWNGFIYGQIKQTEVIEDTGLGFLGRLPSYRGAVYYTPEDKYQKFNYGDMQDETLRVNTQSGWIAMIEHYFVAAMMPRGAQNYEIYSGVSRNTSVPQYRIAYKSLNPVSIAPGETGVLRNALFIGPKDQEMLDEQDVEGLKLTVDYGMFTPFAAPLFWLLKNINNIVANWGWSIIILTLLIKLIFFPLSAKSYKSMAKMRKLQPRLQTLKERYGDDRQKFQQEMMKLYKKEKVNPAGGCLPILVQIPVFLALYWVLLESVELRQAPFILWIEDLSIADPLYILPLLMGVSMFLQQKLNPAPLEPMQQKIMTFLPVIFTVFFIWFPAGLVLYWVVNNCLSILQQYVITKKYTD